MDQLLEAREGAPESGQAAIRPGGVRLLRARLSIGGRKYAISPEGLVRGGELVVLSGPSGCGKTTLLRAIAERRPASVEVGYLAQDLGRAFPTEMPVHELLDARRPLLGEHRELFRRWFGPELEDGMLFRPLGALSEGERQRSLLAAEVVRLERAASPGRLRLLLLDEPFGALDPPAHLRLMDALIGWLGESPDRAAVLVSHSPLVDLGLARAGGVPTTEWTIDRGRT